MKRKIGKFLSMLLSCLIIGCWGCLFAYQGSENVELSSQTKSADDLHFSDLDLVQIGDDRPNQLKQYTGFNLSFNSENHTPNWVAWELLRSETYGDKPRYKKKFWTDESIVGCPSHEDYKKSGYDRGHMVPAADQKWSEQAMFDSFVMTNVCPQNPSLNSGAWSTLESKTRQWAKRDSALIIVAGPIYSDADKERIGESAVRVPSAYFKVIAAPYVAEPRGIGFVYPNMSSPGNMQNYVMTIDEIEDLSKLDFFYNLPDDIEKRIESASSFKIWNKNDK